MKTIKSLSGVLFLTGTIVSSTLSTQALACAWCRQQGAANKAAIPSNNTPPPSSGSPSSRNYSYSSSPSLASAKAPANSIGKLDDDFFKSKAAKAVEPETERGSFDMEPVNGGIYQSGGGSSYDNSDSND